MLSPVKHYTMHWETCVMKRMKCRCVFSMSMHCVCLKCVCVCSASEALHNASGDMRDEAGEQVQVCL